MYVHKNGIKLVKIEESDLLILKNLKDESWFGTHNVSILNMADQKKWFNNLDNDKQLVLKAIDTTTDEVVGIYKVADIDWINRKFNQSHDVFRDFRGKGYGKTVVEAGVDFGFEVLNMNRIDGEILENNIASIKTAIFAGFTQEGIKKKSIYKCGEYLDSIVIGLIRDDWKKLSRVLDYNGICNISYQPKNNFK